VETAQFNKNSKHEKRNSKQSINSKPEILKLTDIKASQMQRTSTGISELDRALGGGLVNGQVVLLAGEPGIGKSTVLLQLANNLKKTLYVSGEESSTQVAIRAERLGIKNKNIDFLESTDVDDIINSLNQSSSNKNADASILSAIIVDSIQTMSTTDLTGLAGSVGQVRECAFRLLKYAKSKNIPLVLVGHVTKEGTVAGPAVLAHIVDTVLWFEGDKKSNLRLLRSVKNRFGSTDEVGIFEMGDKGLKSLDNPEKIFLGEDNNAGVAGSVVSMLMEGSRSILVEIQSLVVPTKMAFPRRVAQGIDSKRLEMLLAVLFRRANVPMYDMDVFVNVAGGIKANDPSMDLAICLSVASSFYEKPLAKKFLALGEIGLSGEVRKVAMQEKRLKDAKRLGFSDVADSTSFKYLSQVIKNYLK
jgi:DNA repair protein RadA/Sms